MRHTNHCTKVDLLQVNKQGSFEVEKIRKRAVYHKQSSHTGKATKISRCMAITENMPDTFASVVRAANRSERTANSNEAKYAMRKSRKS
jgi:hypothetical protein